MTRCLDSEQAGVVAGCRSLFAPRTGHQTRGTPGQGRSRRRRTSLGVSSRRYTAAPGVVNDSGVSKWLTRLGRGSHRRAVGVASAPQRQTRSGRGRRRPSKSADADPRSLALRTHGAWLSARSWENYADYFGHRGFAVSAPEWPRKEGDVEATPASRQRRMRRCRRIAEATKRRAHAQDRRETRWTTTSSLCSSMSPARPTRR
jgi:hypothetical protein